MKNYILILLCCLMPITANTVDFIATADTMMHDISTTAEAVATGQFKGPKSLHEYAQLSDVGDFLLSSGSLDLDINALDEKGRIPLHLAAQAGEKRNYVNLVLRGADINATDTTERTADSYCPDSEDGEWIRTFTAMIREKMATGISQDEAVKAIKDLSGNLDRNIKKWLAKETYLYDAARLGEIDNYVHLVLRGTDINAENVVKRTADSYCTDNKKGKWIKAFTAMIREEMAIGLSQKEAADTIKTPGLEALESKISRVFDKKVQEWLEFWPEPETLPKSKKEPSTDSIYSLTGEESEPDIFDEQQQETEFDDPSNYYDATPPQTT